MCTALLAQLIVLGIRSRGHLGHTPEFEDPMSTCKLTSRINSQSAGTPTTQLDHVHSVDGLRSCVRHNTFYLGNTVFHFQTYRNIAMMHPLEEDLTPLSRTSYCYVLTPFILVYSLFWRILLSNDSGGSQFMGQVF